MASSKVWKTSPPVFVFTCDWAPYPIRVSSRRMSVTDRRGKVLQFTAGLEEPEVEESVSLEGQEGGPRNITLRMLLPVDVSEIMSRGHDWYGVEGELSLYSEAETWEQRLVLVRGRVSPTSVPKRGSFLEVTLAEPAWEDPALWPPADAVISWDLWPDAAEGAIGSAYPWVFGVPGTILDGRGSTRTAPSTACSMIEAVTTDPSSYILIVAGHPVTATTVYVWNATLGETAPFSVNLRIDDGGRSVSMVDITPAPDWLPDHSYYVKQWGTWWGGYGGIADEILLGIGSTEPPDYDPESGSYDYPVVGAPVTGLGSLTLFFLRRSGLKIDLAAWRTVKPILDRTRISGYLDDPQAPLDLVRDIVIPLAPDLALAPGPDGIRPVLFRPLAGRHGISVTMGATYSRVEQPSSADSRPITDCVVEWGQDASLNVARGLTGVTSEQWFGAAQIGPSTHARAGSARHGRQEQNKITTRWLWTSCDAAAVAVNTVRLRWTPAELDSFAGPLWSAPLFPLGEIVELTDAETNQVRVPYWVIGRVFRGGQVEVKLAHVDDPISSPRHTT